MAYQHILLFEISLIHRYYPGEDCPDLILEPTPETKQLLKDYRMIFRFKNSVGSVYFYGDLAADGTATPFFDFDTDIEDFTRFRFYLQSKNSNFLNFTELGVDDLNRRLIYLKGLAHEPPLNPPSGIPLPAIRLVTPLDIGDSAEAPRKSSPVFLYELTPDTGDAPDPIDLEIYNHRDELLETIAVDYDSDNDIYRTEVDLTGEGIGKYTLKYNGNEDDIYVDEHLFKARPFGVLEIYKENWWSNITDSTYRESPLEYRINFTERQAIWYYYILLKSESHLDSSTYEIIDDLTTTDPENRYINTTIHSAPFFFEDITPSGAEIEGYAARIFKSVDAASGGSDLEISYLEEAKPDLTLYKDGTQLITQLPNPGRNSPTAEVIIYV